MRFYIICSVAFRCFKLSYYQSLGSQVKELPSPFAVTNLHVLIKTILIIILGPKSS